MLNWLFETIHADTLRPFGGVRGPTPWYPLGNAGAFVFKMERPWEVIASFAKYGGMTVFWTFGEPTVALNDPALIEQVMRSRREHFYKDTPAPELIPVLTRSTPNVNNGEEWLATRRATPLSRDFASAWMRAQAPSVRALTVEWADRLASKTRDARVDILPAAQRLLFDCFAVGAVGARLSPNDYDNFTVLANYGSARMLQMGTLAAELPPDGVEARERWLAMFMRRIADERAKPRPEACDLLAVTVREGTKLSDRDLAAELGNTWFGGDFSGPSTLVSALYLLTQNGASGQRLADAVAGLEGADIDACEVLDQTLREAMRCLPAVPVWGRRVLPAKPVTLGGHVLPGNTKLYITNWHLQRASSFWAAPESFRPDRWTKDLRADQPYSGGSHFFPMGMGPRVCLGAHYIVFLLKHVLAALAGAYEVECGAGQPYDAGQSYYFATRMPYGLKARVRRRA